MTLVDTQPLIWYFTANRRLGPRAHNRMDEASFRDDAAFSVISLWEIGMLQQKGRLETNMTAAQWREHLITRGFNEIPVDGTIAVRASELPDMHGDPADRIIVATALEGHLLITSDGPILNWPHQLDRFPARR